MLESERARTVEELGHECDLCGHPVLEVHCKVRCPNCGFTRDCSDP